MGCAHSVTGCRLTGSVAGNAMMGVGRAGRSYGWDTAGRGLTKGALADRVPKQATPTA